MTKSSMTNPHPHPFPAHGWVGVGLVVLFWGLNWGLSAKIPITSVGFFPLWVGYCLTVDGLSVKLHGTSLLSRSRKKYISLFIYSAPSWWLFELANWRLQNWHYVGRELFSNTAYFILATLSFSTVMPAVFGTAALFAKSTWFQTSRRWISVKPTRSTAFGFLLFGVAALLLMLIWPQTFFPFLWIAIFCILEPLNIWLGNRALAEHTQHRNWRPVVALFAGTLTCGFFWEFWNFYSYPKWIYTVPWGNFWHIFEMPLLGYGGYLPFGLELFAMYHLLSGIFGNRKTNYLTKALFDSYPPSP